MTGSRVVAVVVAYDRRELLLESLAAIRAQTTPPVAVVVVDNASTDGSAEAVAAAEPAVEVVRLERNTGGAGGFAAGLAVALARHDPDWVWLMDDDTIPTPTALEALLGAVDRGVVLAGSRVVWTDGADHPMNTPRVKPFVSRREKAAARAKGALPVRSSSFVSMLVAAPRVRTVGLPVADYFIWNDDFEYSTRLLRRGRGLFVPSSVVVHKTKARADTDQDPGARFYFEVRNKVWLMRHASGLAPAEKLLYGASTLRRWIRTLRRSPDRALLVHHLRRGLADGLAAPPRANAVVLDGLPVTEAVAALEPGR